jgi:CRP/FNR family cyclic AMP-dependent transcriptional regulator
MMTQAAHIQDDIMQNEELISFVSLFGAMSDEQLDYLISRMSRKSCHSGERLFSKGDLPSSIYILVSGRVDFVTEESGISKIQSVFKTGDCFGETAVIGIQTQLGTAIASGDDVEVLELSREALIDIQANNIRLYGILMMNIAREVSRKYHACVA